MRVLAELAGQFPRVNGRVVAVGGGRGGVEEEEQEQEQEELHPPVDWMQLTIVHTYVLDVGIVKVPLARVAGGRRGIVVVPRFAGQHVVLRSDLLFVFGYRAKRKALFDLQVISSVPRVRHLVEDVARWTGRPQVAAKKEGGNLLSCTA